MAGVKQEPMLDFGLRPDLHRNDIVDRAAVGVCHDRTFVAFQHIKPNTGSFRKQCAAPASRAKRRHRRQGQNLGADGKDGAMGGIVIGG